MINNHSAYQIKQLEIQNNLLVDMIELHKRLWSDLDQAISQCEHVVQLTVDRLGLDAATVSITTAGLLLGTKQAMMH